MIKIPEKLINKKNLSVLRSQTKGSEKDRYFRILSSRRNTFSVIGAAQPYLQPFLSTKRRTLSYLYTNKKGRRYNLIPFCTSKVKNY